MSGAFIVHRSDAMKELLENSILGAYIDEYASKTDTEQISTFAIFIRGFCWR